MTKTPNTTEHAILDAIENRQYVIIWRHLNKELGRRGMGKWQNRMPPEAILAMLDVIEQTAKQIKEKQDA